MKSRRLSERRVFTAIAGFLWALTSIVALLTAVEFGLKIRARSMEAESLRFRSQAATTLERLESAHAAANVQYLHPQYLFFFPLDPLRRVALSNAVVSIDADGFRGAGPGEVAGRRLAFIVGGSVAFGEFASSDETTITGYLNRLQTEYHFVNAGVPSWNSTQEMLRVAFQLIDYRPALVIAFDGANDAGLMERYEKGGRLQYPPGTPESFDRLAEFFDDIRGDAQFSPSTPFLRRLFPQLGELIDQYLPQSGGLQEAQVPVSASSVNATVTRYLANLARMRDLVTANEGRFVAIFQPMRNLHRHVDPALLGPGDAHQRFRDEVVRRVSKVEFYDLSSLFDRYFETVPVLAAGADLADDTIFVDEVHLHDPGNAIVARELWRLIKSQEPPLGPAPPGSVGQSDDRAGTRSKGATGANPSRGQ
jgi:hypothetical protein